MQNLELQSKNQNFWRPSSCHNCPFRILAYYGDVNNPRQDTAPLFYGCINGQVEITTSELILIFALSFCSFIIAFSIPKGGQET